MRYLWIAIISLVFSITAFAQYQGPGTNQGGFVGPSALTEVSKASQVGNAQEDAPCILVGNIVERLNRDRYTFKDESGTVVVNIPPHVFSNTTVTPETKIRLIGEVGGKRHSDQRQDPHVRVRYLEVVK
ncbi:hypothetical protein CUZ56_01951 [Saezia sanguinis]|uniref:Uncharacterized protein n=1 Tax=Saezia sanguinis TaxID=1965230 RepID=A0A433SD61_9BURK|nr:NirD/YgiW/YdeI family stress tolerance protein [Saezia sanguinis]RUS66670.1 hypothetical protein CUZ56_01951 [Saezia sanguinis]